MGKTENKSHVRHRRGRYKGIGVEGDARSSSFLDDVKNAIFGDAQITIHEAKPETKESCAKKCEDFLDSILNSMSSEYVTIRYR